MQLPRTSSFRDQFRGPDSRSFPGQPPKERHGYAFNMPFSELSDDQQEAVHLLFGDSSTWEDSMPRRSFSCSIDYVLLFQDKTWNHLTDEEKEAAKLLNMTEKFWNSKLALFHDDLWSIPDVTLTAKEFRAVLATIQRMSRNTSLSKRFLIEFLLNLERLLLPSQAAAIARVLKASPSWEILESNSNTGNDEFPVHLIVASFLSDPERFLRIPAPQINLFWDDDSGGCVWGNADGKGVHGANKKTYAEALTELIARRQVEPVLTTSVRTSLPALPVGIAKRALDVFLGATVDRVDPFEVQWLHGYGFPLTCLLTKSSVAGATDVPSTSVEESKE